MKKLVKEILRNYCPNIPSIRSKLTKIKLREINKYVMNQEDVLAGEKSFNEKEQMVKKYSEKWGDYTRELNKKLDEYIGRCERIRERNDVSVLQVKVLFTCFAYGFLPDEFFAYELEYKSPQEIKKYISNRELNNYIYTLNDIIDVGIFYDKYKTYVKFKEDFKREAISCKKKSDFGKFCKFVKKHPVYVRKNVALSKGNSVELINYKECGKSTRELFDEMIMRGSYIVEELVVQSECMSKLNPSSVNTIRCITFMTPKGVCIGTCFIKVGQGNSFVDNGGQGGILAGIDNKTGVINTDGYDEFLDKYSCHPDTYVRFKGYQLPEWDKLRSLATKLANQIASVRYIGWDFAYTDSGWVVIEGNGSSQVIGPQIVRRGGIKKEVEDIIKSIIKGGSNND